MAVPEELHLHTAIFIAVDLFAGRAGNHRALAAKDAWLGVIERGAEGDAPWGGGEVVAIALDIDDHFKYGIKIINLFALSKFQLF